MSIKVLLDSNFIMLSSIFHGDLWEEIDKIVGRRTEKIVLKPVYRELNRLLKEDNLKTRKQAEAALNIIRGRGFTLFNIELNPSETVDDLIVRVAKLWNCLVATNDRNVRKKLIRLGVPVIYLRSGSRLELRGKPAPNS